MTKSRLALGVFSTAVLSALVLLVWLHTYSGDIQQRLALDSLSYSTFVKDEQGRYLHILLAKDERYRLRTQETDVDSNYLALLLTYEDKRFYQHYGVDWLSFARALWQNISAQRVVSGASTITMQVVSLLEPTPSTWLSKLVEIRHAIALEKTLNKSQILSLYLSIAPFGGNIESVQMASLYWFGKSSEYLTPSESALLVALPQSPETRRPDRFLAQAQKGRDKVLQRALSAQLITSAFFDAALISPINTTPFEIPKYAPHLAWRCQQLQLNCASTSLNFQMQSQYSQLVKQLSLRPNTNIGVLIADAKTGGIKTYIGSQNYYDFAQLGANDYVQAKRSPGSTLKPFIYAMAVDEGNISFSSIAQDRLNNFAGYQPLNLSKQFVGDITIADALKASLNVPAVVALQGIGVNYFLSRLSLANIDMTNAEGLSVALGGGGLTLWELVKLYTLFSNNGSVLDLHINAATVLPVKLFETNTTHQLNGILSQYARGINRVNPSIINADIALKTGTGPNQSDAWAIGNNGRYVVGVWVGSPSGQALASNMGASAALPVLTRIFDSLPQGHLDKAPLPSMAPKYIDVGEAPLQIIYPEHNSEIDILHSNFRLRPNIVDANYPINVLINEKEMITLNQSSDYIDIAQSGGYSLTIIDQKGRTTSVYFYLRLN